MSEKGEISVSREVQVFQENMIFFHNLFAEIRKSGGVKVVGNDWQPVLERTSGYLNEIDLNLPEYKQKPYEDRQWEFEHTLQDGKSALVRVTRETGHFNIRIGRREGDSLTNSLTNSGRSDEFSVTVEGKDKIGFIEGLSFSKQAELKVRSEQIEEVIEVEVDYHRNFASDGTEKGYQVTRESRSGKFVI